MFPHETLDSTFILAVDLPILMLEELCQKEFECGIKDKKPLPLCSGCFHITVKIPLFVVSFNLLEAMKGLLLSISRQVASPRQI